MDSEFIIYQKFNDIALATELAELLETNNVKYFLEEEPQLFNPTFLYADSKEYVVKIMPEDFEQVNVLLKQNAVHNIEGVQDDYYLLAFTNEELREVVTKADEWNAFDVQLARKLLAERGSAISDDEIAGIEEKRIGELKEPEPSQTTWVILGYIISVGGLAMPFFVSVIGLFVGWHLSSYKKTLPEGERVYASSETDRKHGKAIFFIGIAVFLFGLILYFIRDVFNRGY